MPPIGNGSIGREEANRLADMMRCLADPSRLIIMSVIAQGGSNGAGMQAMVTATEITQPSVSHHLHMLLEQGLVTTSTVKPSGRRRAGVWRIDLTVLDEVRKFLESMRGPAR